MNNNPLTVALFEPRIPQNTGCIGRTCAAFNIPLVLIEPLGFTLEDKYLKRAGLDYWPYINLSIYSDFEEFSKNLDSDNRIIGCSKKGGIDINQFHFKVGDVLLFGREDIGLPEIIRNQCSSIATIPMPGAAAIDGKGGVRSLNLSVASALVTFQAGHKLALW